MDGFNPVQPNNGTTGSGVGRPLRRAASVGALKVLGVLLEGWDFSQNSTTRPSVPIRSGFGAGHGSGVQALVDAAAGSLLGHILVGG